MTRKETLEVDGHTFVVASLTMDQVEEFWDNKDHDIKSLRSQMWNNIIYSLHNAGSDITLEELKKQITFPGFSVLRDTVMKVSGLLPEGEVKATPDLTLPSSVVALQQP